jgi:serine/threonine protein phosphatase PrpC
MALNRYVVNHAALSDIGLKRSLNEDSLGFIEIENGYVFIVCDGMGGHEGGEIASKTAVRYIIEFLNTHKIENVPVALHQAIVHANKQIYFIAQQKPELKGMGTTVVMLLFHNDEIYAAHAGDSRMYILTDNRFCQLSKDHSVVQDMVESGILSTKEAENHPRKNEITKALGVREEILPTISNKSMKAKTGDRFVICSDGLSGLISAEQFRNTVQQNSSPDLCARELVMLAKEGGGDDNISVQIIDIVESPFTESYYPSLRQEEKAVDKKPKKKWKGKIAGLILIMVLLAGGTTAYIHYKPFNQVPLKNLVSKKNILDSIKRKSIADSIREADHKNKEKENEIAGNKHEKSMEPQKKADATHSAKKTMAENSTVETGVKKKTVDKSSRSTVISNSKLSNAVFKGDTSQASRDSANNIETPGIFKQKHPPVKK